MDQTQIQKTIVDQAVAEGGAYEIIRTRLNEFGKQLKAETAKLNEARLREFGTSEMDVLARFRVRTENNCVPRDIVQIGDILLLGYNVFIGLKTETKIQDVFSIFSVKLAGENADVSHVPPEGTFLSQPEFIKDFTELYRYYKNTKLIQLVIKDGKLLAAFQIGDRLEDFRVFRWAVSADFKTITYIDNRGERDIQPPPAFDFEWIQVKRDQVVNGRHPHVNILDTVFVETIGCDLTIKIENNTESGLGIYSESVENVNQSIDDGEIFYAKLGELILLKILPYQEQHWRFLVYNPLTEKVIRIDAIGASCIQLPEDHGLIFPGGYYLQTGHYKTFDEESRQMHFRRAIRSPNGEDVLYVFYEPENGTVGLFAYNLISKTLQNPIYCDGYALSEDGTLVIFVAVNEPTRTHPMQMWKTPFFSDEHASSRPEKQTFLGKIGNPELVRGISDIFGICRAIDEQAVSEKLYQDLQTASLKIFDDHYWVGDELTQSIESLLREISQTADLAISEFEKVQGIRQQSEVAVAKIQSQFDELTTTIRTANWQTTSEHIEILDSIRRHRGAVASTKELRYVDVDLLNKIDKDLVETLAKISEKTVLFLSEDNSLLPYYELISDINRDIERVKTVSELEPLVEKIQKNSSGLDLLSDLLTTIKIDDATLRTKIIDGISEVYAKLNQAKAKANHKKNELGSAEATAQFSAQFKFFSQSITNALGLAHTPESSDEQMSRVLVQLEELESQFAQYDQFLGDITNKREEIYEVFESHKQKLIDAQQKKAQSIADSSVRLLSSIERKSLSFKNSDELNTYFSSDALIGKIQEFIDKLHELDNSVKADDISAKLKAIKDQAIRSIRDKSDLYEGDGKVIKLGAKHKFSVNTQELDLTILPRDGKLQLHLTGTNFYQSLCNPELDELKPFWEVVLESESQAVYRAEYLAASIYTATQNSSDSLNIDTLNNALIDDTSLIRLVREFATPRYAEGYEKGIHDHDAGLILKAIIPAIAAADLLVFDPLTRGFTQVFWANINHISQQLKKMRLSYETWQERAQSALQMKSVFDSQQGANLLASEIRTAMTEFTDLHPIDIDSLHIHRAADYLVQELGRDNSAFIVSKYAQRLVDELHQSLDDNSLRRYKRSLEKMEGWPSERWHLSCAWLKALVEEKDLANLKRYIPEAAALINCDKRLDRRATEADLEISIEQLMGEHVLIQNRTLSFSLDQFLEKIEHHKNVFIPKYKKFQLTRQNILASERQSLRLHEFKPRPLSSFVRNRLINESYLPIIGDNLAKQMGTIGESKRTDLMGLLMMISPPGYGKTTLMEYVASKLGLIFMKINCPSLGHSVLSLDPACAPNATAKQELQKLNLALEMGNNVMLYLDDIQHTNPEFLQKFISLCDGTRRIEGVWQSQTKTYDMRGRKFCVVMAGNPYTESGETFKIPDMLANRADIYNLGDILGGMNEQFELSYIENSLTSNPILSKLATRDINDVYSFVKMAQGEAVPTTDLKHQYSGAEIQEITEVMKKLFAIRDTILKVNKQYIKSSAQADQYRVEPPFKLQGSYRNMNKMAEKVSAIMNSKELDQLISDHYIGEAQLLTKGTEENLLKLGELRGVLTVEEQARWEQIKVEFKKNQATGGDSADTGTKVVTQLYDLNSHIKQLSEIYSAKEKTSDHHANQRQNASLDLSSNTFDGLALALEKFASQLRPEVTVVNEPVPGLDQLLRTLTESIETSLFPIVKSMDKKLEIDLRTHYKMKEISKQLMDIELKIQKELNEERDKLPAAVKQKLNDER